MKLKITEITEGSFEGINGPVEYWWYKGQDDDGLTIRFGSTDGTHELGETYELRIETTKGLNRAGKAELRYRELVAKQ